jgi:hypothetical protein
MHWGFWLLLAVGLALVLFWLRHSLIGLWTAFGKRIQVPQRVESRPQAQPLAPVERPSAVTPTAKPSPDREPIDRQTELLGAACRRNDAQAAALALLALGRIHWPDAPPTNLGDLAGHLPHAQAELEGLDRVLYGIAQRPWDGAALWAAIGGVEWQADATVVKRAGGSSLPPLYPQNG